MLRFKQDPSTVVNRLLILIRLIKLFKLYLCNDDMLYICIFSNKLDLNQATRVSHITNGINKLVLHYSMLEILVRYKHSRLLDPFVSYKKMKGCEYAPRSCHVN
jgi:hypothetical protein